MKYDLDSSGPTLVAISLFEAIMFAAICAPLYVREKERTLKQNELRLLTTCELRSSKPY